MNRSIKNEIIITDRSLYSLDETAIKQILYSPGTDPTRVKMVDRFEEQEIIDLCNHPQWEDFSEEFKQLIYDSIANFLHRDFQLMKQAGSGIK